MWRQHHPPFVALVLFFGLCGVFWSMAAAQDQAAKSAGTSSPTKGKPAVSTGSAAARIIKALDEPTEVDFIETPLKDVADAIKTRHAIEIQLVGVNTDEPITRSLKGVSLRSARQLMLAEHGLTFLLNDEVLVITQQDGDTDMLLYDVADLTRGGWTIDEVAEAVRFALPKPVASPTAGPVRRPGGGASAPSSPRSAASASFHLASQAGVAEPPVESEVLPLHGVLFVRTTYRGHMDVGNLLIELRHRMEVKSE